MLYKLKTYLGLLSVGIGMLLLGYTFSSAGGLAAEVRVVSLASTINPAIAEYLKDEIDSSNLAGDVALIIELDTPGGLDTSMREIIQAMLASDVPIVVYVSPSGARAASAGALITLAADLAAMAPGTNIGAAHPVSIGWQGAEEDADQGVSMTKALNDAVAYARSLAEQRGRNPDWAEQAVRKSSSVSAREALKLKVVDLLAENLDDLLVQLHGRSYLHAGEQRQLQIAEAEVVRSEMPLRLQILNTLANPNVAYLLLMLGILGIFFEISQPGVILPGVLGAIALLLAFYSLQALPINYSGILLIILGMILFLLEVKIVSYGMLSVGGLVALLFDSLMLVKTGDPAMTISPGVIGATVAVFGGFVLFVGYFVVRTQQQQFFSGAEALIGEQGEVVAVEADGYRVFVHGELWSAKCDQPLEISTRVKVVELLKGMKLKIKPAVNSAEGPLEGVE